MATARASSIWRETLSLERKGASPPVFAVPDGSLRAANWTVFLNPDVLLAEASNTGCVAVRSAGRFRGRVENWTLVCSVTGQMQGLVSTERDGCFGMNPLSLLR